jgi:hypothetical protein
VVTVALQHLKKHYRRRQFTVVKQIATEQQQYDRLDKALLDLEKVWDKTFGTERWTCYLHLICKHTMVLMKEHRYIGWASQSNFEAFHKLMRWWYQHTNREGGDGDKKVEASQAVLTKVYGLEMLEIELREEYCHRAVHAMRLGGANVDFSCGGSCVDCAWPELEEVVDEAAHVEEDEIDIEN